MTAATAGDAELRSTGRDSRYLILSTDSHVGPTMDDLRPYGESAYREDFEAYAALVTGGGTYTSGYAGAKPAEIDALAAGQGEHPGVRDPNARLQNMDEDGIAAEVIFHGAGVHSRRKDYLPFHPGGMGRPEITGGTRDQMAAGQRMYNRWLADFCSVDPDRLIGVAQNPSWDVEAAVKEIRWAVDHGLKGANFAAPRPDIMYADPKWEPLWSTVEELGISLNCHAGGSIHDFSATGLAYRALNESEAVHLSHLPLPMMSFGGVFDRHPGLRLVLNEQRGYWVEQTLRDLDSIHISPWNRTLKDAVPQPPSYHWRHNCLLGGSFMARFETEDRYAIGIETITWARDFPHVEGTWPTTLAALRHAFAGLPFDEVTAMLGTNALRAYPVDEHRLRSIADRIGPKVADIDTRLELAPEGSYSFAFRDMASAPGGARFGGY